MAATSSASSSSSSRRTSSYAALMASRTSRGNAGSRVSSSFRAGTSAAKSRRVAYYERPPVVMEWGCTLLRIGYAEQNQHRPQHTIVLRQPLPSLDSQEQEWYSFVAPLLQTAWDRLMLSSFLASSSSSSSSSGNTNTNARRVVCVHSPYLPRAWERAITQALWNLQVPSIALVHNVETVPIALGWKRGMVVHVGMDEAQCLAHVDGHPLRYTYQGKKTAVCVQVVPPFSNIIYSLFCFSRWVHWLCLPTKSYALWVSKGRVVIQHYRAELDECHERFVARGKEPTRFGLGNTPMFASMPIGSAQGRRFQPCLLWRCSAVGARIALSDKPASPETVVVTRRRRTTTTTATSGSAKRPRHRRRRRRGKQCGAAHACGHGLETTPTIGQPRTSDFDLSPTARISGLGRCKLVGYCLAPSRR